MNPRQKMSLLLLIITLTSITPLLATAGTPPDPNGLVAYWKFNEEYLSGATGQVIDSSGNGNHGTPQNGVITVENGVEGRAGQFDGANDRVVIPPDLSPTPSSQITVMAWIKPDKVPTHGNWRYDDPIVGKRWSYCLRISERGRIGFHFHNTPYIYDAWLDGSSMKPYEGQWVHVAATYDGSASTIYINGEVDVSAPRSGPIYDSYVTPCISYVDYSRFFDGMIDEVMVYNRALSSQEIKDYVKQENPKEAALNLVSELEPDDYRTAFKNRLVVNYIEKSLSPELWVDETHLDPARGWLVFSYEFMACSHMKTLIPDNPGLADVYTEASVKLAEADEELAKVLLEEAEAAAPPLGTPTRSVYDSYMGKALMFYENGVEYMDAGDYCRAILQFEYSWLQSKTITQRYG